MEYPSISPSEVPSRANIAALKSIGCQVIVAFSAVGSLREEFKPRDIVIPQSNYRSHQSVRPTVAGFEPNDQIGVHADKVAICMEVVLLSPPELKAHLRVDCSDNRLRCLEGHRRRPVTAAEVMATIASNVSVSNRLTLTILDEVHNAVAKGQIKTCKGSMQYGVMTENEAIPEESKKMLSFLTLFLLLNTSTSLSSPPEIQTCQTCRMSPLSFRHERT
ncbi:hypothetical protein KEM48_014546 [Puccinia striiformis f. sp. tritici PST-130]|nr:hypothetical protein KEM48_014546 [Puccinia striiformis f. sp. tritici PST-130]